MSEKPKKRVVSGQQYLRTLCKKGILNTSSVASGCLGIYFLLGAALTVMLVVARRTAPVTTYSEYWITLITAGLGIVAIWLTTILIRKSKKIEPVQPLTVHNAHLLPPEESLVRPSDLPPSHQQAELLRASPQGSETPPEELLRATTNRQGE